MAVLLFILFFTLWKFELLPCFTEVDTFVRGTTVLEAFI